MNVITFQQAHKKAIDIVDSWVSTNTDQEVTIIKNIKDKYEIWLNCDTDFLDTCLLGIYDTFDIAVRYAECMVDVYEPAWGNPDDWTPRARGWCQ